MVDLSNAQNQIRCVSNFQELISISLYGEMNALCWSRKLEGDFFEIVKKIKLSENIKELNEEDLFELNLSAKGKLARDIILSDMNLLKSHGASPSLNIIKGYDRDKNYPFFPTDVYSFHVDRSPIPTDTFLCTYFGEASELLPNSQAEQKIRVPEIRNELKKLYHGPDDKFEFFLEEHFFDLHYRSKPEATPINLGIGNIWKLAVDYPESKALPCVHRAPQEKTGESRLLLIC